VFQRGRDAFEQRDRALRREHWLESGSLRDLGKCFLEPRDRWLRLPSEGVPPDACLEAPGVATSARHVRRSHSSGASSRSRANHVVLRVRYADARVSRANRPGSTTAARLKQRNRESHELVLDAGERRLAKSVERCEWTTVAGFRAAQARHARSAAATRRRFPQSVCVEGM